MGDVINLEMWKQSKEEERKRLRNILTISNRISSIDGIINNIDDCVGVSIITKHFDSVNGVIGKESLIDEHLLNVIYKAIDTYKEELNQQLNELNKK